MSILGLPRIGTHVSVATAAETLGSLGVVVQLPDGPFAAVTAGHVVRMARGAELMARTVNTTMPLGKPMVTLYDEFEDIDLALLGPLEGDVTSVSGDLVFVRDPNLADINRQFAVYRPRDVIPTLAWVHDVGVPAEFFRVDGPGIIRLEGLVSIDGVTEKGDSGGAVLDESDNLVGFVVGGDGLRTYLLPAERGLHALAQHLQRR